MKKNIGILSCFLTILITGSLIFNPALATDASLLPNAVQQFFNSAGQPLNNGKVYFYEVGTSTFKSVYTSSAATTPYTNPITLNAGGKPPGASGIYGIGLYRQLVKDSANNVIWDAVTAPGGGGGSPTLVGDGNAVGTIITWAGLVAPGQYVFTYGQELSRLTYPEFYTTITQQLNVICTSASNILTGVSDTSQIKIGSPVELSLCVVAGTTVTAKTSSTVTLSNSSSVTINTTATFFPWGNGNGSTTFNVPNLNGSALVARNNMGGTPSAKLTSTYYGAVPDALGAVGGNQTNSLIPSNLPPYTPAGTVAAPTITSVVSGGSTGGTANNGTAAGATQAVTGPTAIVVTSTSTAPVFTGSAQGGTSSPFSVIQPSITMNYVIKITPDTPISSNTVVTNINGMTGTISCDTTFKCQTTGSTNGIGLATQSNNTLLANVSGGVAQATPTSFTRTGNTWALVTSSGTLTNGHCVSIDSSGNYVDAGGACTTGGGGGTVTAATAGQLAYYNSTGTTVVGLNVGTGLTISGSNLNSTSSFIVTTNKTSNYTAASTDCGTTLSLQGNTQFTLTVGAASGFTTGCVIGVVNNDSAIGSSGHGKVMAINGVTLPIDFLYPGMAFQIQNINNVWVISGLPPRLKITAPITVYVATGGSDSNDGLTSGNAKLTIEAALLQGISNFDLNGVGAALVIQVAAGTYTSTGDMVHYSGRNVGAQGGCAITVQGATGLALDIRLVATSGDVFSINTGAIICLRDLSVSTVTSGNGITSDANSKVYVRNLSFYAVAGDHMLASNNSSIEMQSSYFIRGSTGGAHVHAANGGYINNNGFGAEFSSLSSASFAYFALATSAKIDFSGTIALNAVTVTGQRFLSQQNGTINTSGGGANYFPGSIAGQGTNAGTSPYGLYQ